VQTAEYSSSLNVFYDMVVKVRIGLPTAYRDNYSSTQVYWLMKEIRDSYRVMSQQCYQQRTQ